MTARRERRSPGRPLAARRRPEGERLPTRRATAIDGGSSESPRAGRQTRGILAGISPPSPASRGRAPPTATCGSKIPAGAEPLRFTLGSTGVADRGRHRRRWPSSIKNGRRDDLAALTSGGPARGPRLLTTAIELGARRRPVRRRYVLTHPESNPWLCQMRLTGFDFFPAAGGPPSAPGTATSGWSRASTTRRASSDLAADRVGPVPAARAEDPRRQRSYVGCRDQIVILRDLNGDGETDFYENFNSDHQVTEHFHEFAMDLQTDADGNFYYAKAARHGKTALVPQHGTLLRVSKDGVRTEILATGFRAPNGVCLNADGTFFLTDQEGFWTPKNRINRVKSGGFYGNMWGYHDVTDPSDSAMEPPVCWITNAFDRSPGRDRPGRRATPGGRSRARS